MRVINVLKHWLDRFKDDFYDSEALCDKVLAFVQRPDLPTPSKGIIVRIKDEIVRCVCR